MMPARNQNWLPSLFNEIFGDEWIDTRTRKAATPAVNIIENDKDFQIEIAAPGMTKEDVCLNVNDDNELVISLERRSESADKDAAKGTYLRREFAYSAYRQSFTLPENIELPKIEARMENGVLTICLPKKEETKQASMARQIAIK